jgi:hypothetical protein
MLKCYFKISILVFISFSSLASERRNWTQKENNLLIKLVNNYKSKEIDWNEIAKSIPDRNRSQCKEKWRNCLNPELDKSPLTDAECKLIKDLQLKFGNQWTLIAEELPSRSAKQIRNYWYSPKGIQARYKNIDDDEYVECNSKLRRKSPFCTKSNIKNKKRKLRQRPDNNISNNHRAKKRKIADQNILLQKKHRKDSTTLNHLCKVAEEEPYNFDEDTNLTKNTLNSNDDQTNDSIHNSINELASSEAYPIVNDNSTDQNHAINKNNNNKINAQPYEDITEDEDDVEDDEDEVFLL